MNSTEILSRFLSLALNKTLSQKFVITDIKEGKDRIDLRLEEKETLVPRALSDYHADEVVLDGFCNPIEVQSFVMQGKAVFLMIYRRRWKQKGQSIHYSNQYDLHPEGVKATHEFASFLKEEYGWTPEQHYDYIRSLWSKS